MRTGKRQALLFAATASALIQSAFAANQTWDSLTSDGSWSTAANWSAGPLANGDVLTFDAAATTSLNNDLVGSTFNGIAFTANAPSYTLNGNGITLGFMTNASGITSSGDIVSSAVANQTIGFPVMLGIGKHLISTGANALNLAGPITQSTGAYAIFSSGGGAINTTGSGLANDSSANGGILGGGAIMQSGSFAALDVNNPDPSQRHNVVPYTGYVDVAPGGVVASDPTANVRFNTTGGAAINLAGVFGNGVITTRLNTIQFGSGTASFAANQTVSVGTGSMLILGQNGGIFVAESPTATSRSVVIGSSVPNGGILTAGDGIHPANITLSSNYATEAQHVAGIVTINSAITDNGGAPVSVTVAGGYTTLSGANTYSGGTYVLSGRVSQPVSNTFGTGPIYVYAGAVINPGSGFPMTLGNNIFISGFGTSENAGQGAIRMFQNTNGQNTQLTGTVTLTQTAAICSNGLTFSQANDSSRGVGISGRITGPGGLTIGSPVTTSNNGTGVVCIGAFGGAPTVNDYAGNTTISGALSGAGVGAALRISAPSDDDIMPHGLTGSYAGGPTGNVVLDATDGTRTATFDLNGSIQTINGLTNTGRSPGNNTVLSYKSGGLLIMGDSDASATYSGNIQDGPNNGTMSIAKMGLGVETFSGNINYTGSTSVIGGTLVFASPASTNSSKFIDVQSGAVLDVSNAGGMTIQGGQSVGGRGAIAGNVSMSDSNALMVPGQLFAAGTLTVNGDLTVGGGTIRMDLATPNIAGGGVNDLVQVNGSLNLSGTTTIKVDRPAAGLVNGTYPLVRYTGTLGNSGNFALTQNTRPTLSINTATNGEVDLMVSGNPSLALTWSGGNNSNSWDLVSTQNFNSGVQQFYNWDSVTFDDNGNNSQDISISGSLEPTAVTISNSLGHPYNFTGGSLINVANLNKTGAGAATLNDSANQFDSVTVSNGTLVFQNGNNLISSGTVSSGGNVMITGQGTFSSFTVNPGGNLWIGDGINGSQDDLRGSVTDNGIVTFQHNGDFDFQGSVSGTGALVKTGTGQVQMDAASPNFTGEVDIQQGRVRLNANSWELLGSVNGGTVVISSGAQLALDGINIANLGGLSENAGGGFGNKLFKIEGTGNDGNGAIVNNGASQATAFQRVTLTNDATINASSRIDVRSIHQGGVNQGTLDLAGHTLTKIGDQVFGLASVNVTDGNIRVNAGTLQIEGGTNIASLSANASITVASGLGVNFASTTGTVTRPIVFSGDGALNANNSSVTNTISTVGSNITLNGNLALNSAGTGGNQTTLVLNGNISESPSASGRTFTKNNGNSTVILGGSNSYTGATTVAAGTLITNTSFQNTPISIATGSTLRVSQRATSGVTSGVSVVPSLSIAGTGVLDLTNNGLVIEYTGNPTPLSTIQGYVKAGYNNGLLNGTGGINSSTAAGFDVTSNPNKRAIGYAESSALGVITTGSFLGKTVDNQAILVRYTLSGDSNLDGTVNALDFNALATNFGASGTGIWTGGDFNNDSNVDTSDFTLLAQNFNQVLPSAPPAPVLGALVPEPGMLTMLAIEMTILGARRRRR